MKATYIVLFAAVLIGFGCSREREQAPGYYQTAGLSKDQVPKEVLAPSKDFEKESPGAEEDEGLFLQSTAPTTAPTGTAPTTTTTTAASGQRINAIGANGSTSGYYQKTSQGYQYYNSGGKATNWFGQPGTNGAWAMTQGNYDQANKSYGFAQSPTLLMNKGTTTNSWNGSWQQQQPQTKAYTPVGSNYQVNYNPGAGQNAGYSTQVFRGDSKNTYLNYNSWMPNGTPQYFNNGSQMGQMSSAPQMNFNNRQVPSTQQFQGFFGNDNLSNYWSTIEGG